ncbi:alkaline phosphatase family protein [Actinocrispum wychmicini]|uniref:phospholipase C n=1 Tax=Actinocrispum wychmicini TaxID=1213861 RepID=A0A4R2J0J4_9PSEU|nr:alkaline phosphatase family protein [Actinocrispum wychmicini]TCO49709.1 phospholipase C [Actinocrispum wychmicini]
MSDVTRREFIVGTASAVAAAGATTVAASSASAAALPDPKDSGIDHIVVVMMENRSFDHYLGWLPGADGEQAGLTFTDSNGVAHQTHHLTVPHGCGFNDPDHSYQGGRVELNNGACDGWLRAGKNDVFSIGYFEAADLGFYGHAARDWTVCDRYFAAMMAPTFPNRFFLHSAQTDRTTTSVDKIATMPAIWDRLTAAGVPGRYFFTDVPYTALWGTRYLGVSRPILEFYAAAAVGALPPVSFVEPGFLGEAVPGLSQDEHPLADIRLGQHFLASVYNAVVSSPNWAQTALVITYDEWGGFFDHVVPPVGPDPNPDLGAGLRGFRVPCVVVSPRSRRSTVAHGLYDHTSILKMIEWRFGLPPLTVRDAAANNLAEVLDFDHPPNLAAPRYDVPLPITFGCLLDHAHSGEDWPDLAAKARDLGFPLG